MDELSDAYFKVDDFVLVKEGKIIDILKKPTVNDYVVINKKHEVLGQIAYVANIGEKLVEKWFFYPALVMMTGDLYFSSRCLLEIARFLEAKKRKGVIDDG